MNEEEITPVLTYQLNEYVTNLPKYIEKQEVDQTDWLLD